jgi:hypothetical protein
MARFVCPSITADTTVVFGRASIPTYYTYSRARGCSCFRFSISALDCEERGPRRKELLWLEDQHNSLEGGAMAALPFNQRCLLFRWIGAGWWFAAVCFTAKRLIFLGRGRDGTDSGECFEKQATTTRHDISERAIQAFLCVVIGGHSAVWTEREVCVG